MTSSHVRAVGLAAVLLAATVGSHAQGGKSVTLRVTYRQQEERYWCWAAAGEMLMETAGKRVRQCAQVATQFNQPNCCPGSPTPTACNRAGAPVFAPFGFVSKPPTKTFSESDIVREMDIAKRPFMFRHDYSGGKWSHYFVAYGFELRNGLLSVRAYDPETGPLRGSFDVPYYEFLSGPDYVLGEVLYGVQ